MVGEEEEVGGVGKEGRAGRTERRRQNRNVCEILVPDLNGRDILEDLGLDGYFNELAQVRRVPGNEECNSGLLSALWNIQLSYEIES